MTAKGSGPTSDCGDQHGVAQAERFTLTDVREVDQVRDVPNLGEQLFLAARLEERLELDRDVEMILDRVLAASGDQDDVGDAGRDRLFDAVLDDWLVDERQHLFRLRLGRREKPRAESCGRKDGFAQWRSHHGHGTSGAAPSV